MLSLMSAPAAWACTRVASQSVQNLSTLPREGSSAPRNTRLWTIALATEEGAFRLVDSRGSAVMLQRSSITVSGEQAVNLEILTPMSLLEPGAWTFSRGGTILSRFTVIDEVDQTAPAALTPAVTNVDGKFFGAYSCGRPALVTVELGGEAELAIAAAEGSTWQVSNAMGVATGSTVQIFSPAEGEHRIVVFHVDLAGNSAVSAAVTATVPAQTSGCSVGPMLPLGILALALLGVRRSRLHRQTQP